MKHYIKVPTWSPSLNWHYTTFDTREEFRDFVKGIFKEPGQYNFDETAFLFNQHARTFQKKKMFCEAPEMSRDYIEFWDTEKEKCRKGCIYKNDKGGIWYLTRFYYHWGNFLRIYFKALDRFDFPDVRDVQYHMALYECLAELHDKNAAILKKRQIASSYFHICKLYNRYLFDEGSVCKIGASDKKYINATNGSWKFLSEYHNFTNKETAWACTNLPDKMFDWQQKVETKTADGRKVQIGTMATITGLSFDKDPASGVGGACKEFFYEEGGIAPTADTTYGYMRQALREGALTTGIFVIAGSVGDLDQCEPLKNFILQPDGYDIYAIDSDLIDENGTKGRTGLFIPEQWGMPPFIDEYGNSKVKEALEYLDAEYARLKPIQKAEDHQLEISQRPRNIKEAFAIRTVSIFPIKHTSRQVRRIEDGEVYTRNVELERNDKNIIVEKETYRKPMEYPSSMKMEDKRGCIVIHEGPIKDAPWSTYIGSVDPIETGDTKTSESLASIYIWKMPVEVTRTKADGTTETFIENGKIVAWWTGRYDDPISTNEQLSLLVEYYNAKTTCEKNKPGFISYMQLMKRQRYLAHIDDMIFDKEYEVRDNTYKAYGWVNTPALWKKILEYGIDSISEDTGPIGTPIYGVERIPDIWLLKEMQNYTDKGNFDRIIAYCALIAFAKRQEIIMGTRKRVERTDDQLKQANKIKTTLDMKGSIFNNMGGRGMTTTSRNRSFTRNLK